MCDNFTSWGFRLLSADSQMFRYLKRESATDLTTHLETFIDAFNTKWSSYCEYSDECRGCPMAELATGRSDEDGVSYGSHRLFIESGHHSILPQVSYRTGVLLRSLVRSMITSLRPMSSAVGP